MNMLEALKAIKENEEKRTINDVYSFCLVWARPKSWKGYSTAFCYRQETEFRTEGYEIVPNSSGGMPPLFPRTRELFEEWEIVTPEQANNGE